MKIFISQKLFPHRSGLRVLKARKTRSTPRIPLSVSVVKEMTRSTNEKRTSTPSMIFQPDLRYASGPTINPSDITFKKRIFSDFSHIYFGEFVFKLLA